MKNRITATSLRATMRLSITIIIIASATGFYFAQDYLNNSFVDNKSSTENAQSTNNVASDYSKTLAEISKNKPYSDISNSIFTTASDYQAQINNDLDKYSSSIGIKITNKKWLTPTESSEISSSMSGLNANFVTITIKNQISMSKLLQFIKATETNLPKMQIINISIKNTNKSSDLVTVDPITIATYPR
jgi:hypothetical protein